MLAPKQGEEIVRLSRRTLDSFVSAKERPRDTTWSGYLGEKRGVFVTLNLSRPEGGSLRGCIGFPLPVKVLGDAVCEATIAAAAADPRFPPVQPSELDEILVEVSALTKPEKIRVARRKDLPSSIMIGEDGLIVSAAFQSGLLLPQVAVELRLQPVDFLSEACIKAGLPPDSWLLDGVSVQKFQAEVFAEEKPRGNVKRVVLK